MKRNLHVIAHNHGWAVRVAGGRRVLSVHVTQREAIFHGQSVSRHRGVVLYVHARDGSVRFMRDYSTFLDDGGA